VARWRYKPALQDGKPLEVSWEANVIWKLGETPAVRRAESCLAILKGAFAIPPGIGATELAFRIMPDGTMKDAVVTHSSGDQSIDDLAKLCITTSRYDVSIITLPSDGVPGHADWDWAHASVPDQPAH
jgi:hypothetical protein